MEPFWMLNDAVFLRRTFEVPTLRYQWLCQLSVGQLQLKQSQVPGALIPHHEHSCLAPSASAAWPSPLLPEHPGTAPSPGQGNKL